jgi:hypothetical protein
MVSSTTASTGGGTMANHPTRRQYRHIEALLTLHFHGMTERAHATAADLASVRKRMAEINELIQSGDLVPSTGVASYEGITATAGGHSDPTPNAAAAFAREVGRFRGELCRLHASEATYASELYELEIIQRHTGAAVRMLHRDAHALVTQRFDAGDTLTRIAIDRCCDEGTVRYHLADALRMIDRFVAPRLTRETLPFCAHYLPDIFPINPRQFPCFPTGLVLQ